MAQGSEQGSEQGLDAYLAKCDLFESAIGSKALQTLNYGLTQGPVRRTLFLEPPGVR